MRHAILAASLCACSSHAAPASTPATTHMTVSRADQRPTTPGPAATFAGSVNVTQLFSPANGLAASGGRVTFQPGARSAWHTHGHGQLLIITDGTGWVQEEGAQKIEVHAGDVIWTPPGVKHWHGATATTAMTHIAIQEPVNGQAVDWLEQVTDEQYNR